MTCTAIYFMTCGLPNEAVLAFPNYDRNRLPYAAHCIKQ